MTLEVCVDCFTSILTAQKAGADRIELCSALNIGGLTPSYGLMKQAKQIEDMEIFVMIRPRSGDFLYDDNEIQAMKHDIEITKEMGFDGIVIGMLKADGNIDMDRMKEFCKLAYPLKVVLHRAFDDANQPMKDIQGLIDMGVCRILTSGQRSVAPIGAEIIAKIQLEYGDKITIMPGCGVNAKNIEKIHETTKCTNYHLSGKMDIGSKMEYRDCIERMNTPKSEFSVERSDYQLIKDARDILNKLK